MRLFVAVNLPDSEKTRLGAVLDQLRRTSLPVRWTAADAIHITIKFLGEVAEQRGDEIAAALSRAALGVAPFDVELTGFGAFPAHSRPRVFWIGVVAPLQMRVLQERVEREIQPLGFPPDDRGFSPHLTLGRVKSTGRLDHRDVERIAPRPEYHAVIRIESVDLMRSHLGRGGARHERIGRAVLQE